MPLRYNNCIKVHIYAEEVYSRQHRNVTEKAELYKEEINRRRSPTYADNRMPCCQMDYSGFIEIGQHLPIRAKFGQRLYFGSVGLSRFLLNLCKFAEICVP